MLIKNPLTKTEMKIINTLEDTTTIITNKTLHAFFPEYNKQKINEIVISLYKKKYFIKLEKSKYLLAKEYSIDEIYSIACKLPTEYIALTSALYFYQALEYEPFTIYVINNKVSKEYQINNYTLKYTNLKKITTFFKYEKNILLSFFSSTINHVAHFVS